MKLGSMLKTAGGSDDLLKPMSTPQSNNAERTPSGQTQYDRAVDPFQILKGRAQEGLFGRLGSRLYDTDFDRSQLHAFVVQELDEVMRAEDIPLTEAERQRLVNEVKDDILGYGPIERYLQDEEVSEIMVNGDDAIYVERGGRLHLTESRFASQTHLRQVIERIVSQVGRRVDESSPMVDARLPDGSRVNAIIPPLAVRGAALTIRKFSAKALGVEDLIRFGTFTPQSAEFLEACIRGKLNVLVSGGTGTGKTTLLNILSGFIPNDERIVTIEDAVELRLRQRHVISLESRPANVEGKGAVPIRDLVKNSLRMRPDRVVVGECRAGEALDMLQAMNTGHDGSLSTLHANTPRDAIGRLETMVLMAGMDLPIRAIREQVASAVDLIVQISRLRDGSRKITKITEIVGMEGDIVTLSDIFALEYDDTGGGMLRATGIRPQFTEKLEQHGVKVPLENMTNEKLLASRTSMRG